MEENVVEMNVEIGEKFLPVGTVVLLKGGSKRAMIIGYCPVTEDGQAFDYSACLYPEGVISSKEGLLFNHDQIVKIFHTGYADNEEIIFIGKLKEILSKIATGEIGPDGKPTAEVQAKQQSVGGTIETEKPSISTTPISDDLSTVRPVTDVPAPGDQPAVEFAEI